MERRSKIALAITGGLAALLILAWLGRAWLAEQAARHYFAAHGVNGAVQIGDLGLSGASGSFALGPADAPEISARRIELHFDPLSWLPRVVEVRLVDPVIRARVDADGRITLPSLQTWIDSLTQTQGKSRWVSDDLAVAMTGLDARLTTPAGPLRIGGDLKLVRSLPVVAHLALQPATIGWRRAAFTVRAARLDYDVTGRLRLHVAGDARDPGLAVQGLTADIVADGLIWRMTGDALSLSVSSLHLTARAASVSAVTRITAPMLDVTLTDGAATVRGGAMDGRGSLRGNAQGDLDPALANILRAQDPALAHAVARNLSRLNLSFAAHVERQRGAASVTLTRPLLLTGAGGGRLSAESRGARDWHLVLAGTGLPSAALDLRNLDIGNRTADAALSARFNYAMLKNAALAGRGAVAWRDNRLIFTPTACLHATAASFTTLARKASADLCPADRKPLLSAGADGWAFHAAARNAGAFLPLANAELRQGAGVLDFAQGPGARHGRISLRNAVLADHAAGPRFLPLDGAGTITLAGDRWQGHLTVRDAKKDLLGETSFTHDMGAGRGTAHISAARLAFAPGRLQPADLSPLLVALRRAEGTARFEGDIAWNKAGFTSSGRLGIDKLDFMTPLGKAHAVKTDIAFTSLLPPVTAPDQSLVIDRIDWTVPLSRLSLSFDLGKDAVTVHQFETDFAEGHALLGNFAIKLADPQHLSGTVLFSNVSLQSLIAASNLAEKVKTQGTISGAIPFTLTPEGFRITDGHIAADHPGRLSLSRSLWAQGDAAISSNAVQDFAYQALENMAFSKMTADLKSVAGGRLQIVFHLVGKSDPPKPQVAEVALGDILNGTALYKPIPLPSGTPIDLTLDSSLNFDELLKSYAEAWSKSLNPAAGEGAGAKP